MENQDNLASPNFEPAVTGSAGTVLVAQPADAEPGWQRNLMVVFMFIMLFAVGAGLVGTLVNWGSIPACDASFIKSVSTTDAETTCTANLALWGGGTVEYDYRIFRENKKVEVQITNVRR